MNRKFTLTIAAYFVSTMATAYPWHMFLFHEKYVQMGAMTRGEPIMAFGIIAILLQGGVIAYLYPLFYQHKRGGHPIVRGLQFSLFLGLMVYSVMVFATAAKFQIEPWVDFLVLGTVFQLIQFSVFGVILGLVHGRLNTATNFPGERPAS